MLAVGVLVVRQSTNLLSHRGERRRGRGLGHYTGSKHTSYDAGTGSFKSRSPTGTEASCTSKAGVSCQPEGKLQVVPSDLEAPLAGGRSYCTGRNPEEPMKVGSRCHCQWQPGSSVFVDNRWSSRAT